MKYYKSTTKFNCGIDLHGREMYICLVDQEGNKLVHANSRMPCIQALLRN